MYEEHSEEYAYEPNMHHVLKILHEDHHMQDHTCRLNVVIMDLENLFRPYRLEIWPTEQQHETDGYRKSDRNGMDPP